jgi:hypothetical protein
MRSPKVASPQRGICVIVTDDYRFLTEVRRLGDGRSLTPWIRRRDAIPVEIPLRLQNEEMVPVDRGFFRQLIDLARSGQVNQVLEIRVQTVGKFFAIQADIAGDPASALVARESADIEGILMRLGKHRQKLRITIFSNQMDDLTRIHAFVPEAEIVFSSRQLGRRTLGKTPNRIIRDVLVFTNISGPKLPILGQDLPFWSRGLPGFRFRHVYGQLNSRRVNSNVFSRDWDCIIYRGHASANAGRLTWNLSDGAWPVPSIISELYIHAACLENPPDFELRNAPAPYLLTPLTRLEDFDDRTLVRRLLERYSISQSLKAAIRAVQELYPSFVYISTA